MCHDKKQRWSLGRFRLHFETEGMIGFKGSNSVNFSYFSQYVKNLKRGHLLVMIVLARVTIHHAVTVILVLNLVEKLMTHLSVPRQNGNGTREHLLEDSIDLTG